MAVAALWASPSTALAQQDYPNKPVKWIVPYPPAGTTDVLARMVAQWLTEKMGQPFVVENRPGAGNNIGTEAVIKSPPDGYTMLLVNPANGINATLYKNLNFNFIRDIAPVAGLVRTPNVMEVTNSLPVKTVKEFIDYCKANPGKINMASSGSGTSVHLSGELFKFMTGCDMVHVPYKGAGPALVDLIGGQVHVLFDNLPSSIGHIRSGKLRPIAVDTAQHLPQLPEVPRLAEHGYKDFETSQWYGTLAPAGTPRDIVGRLQEESLKALKSNAVTEPFASDGAVGDGGPPWEVAAFIGQQEIWKDIVLRAGIKPDQPDRGGRACAAPRTVPLPML